MAKMNKYGKGLKVSLVLAGVILLIGIAVIAIAEPVALNRVNAEYVSGEWAWYNENKSYIYETTSTNIKTIGMILSVVGAIGVVLIPSFIYKNTTGEK